MAEGTHTSEKPPPQPDAGLDTEFKRGLGLFDATMVVVGSMIGSGIFIVSAEMARRIGSPGWLLVAWLITGFLTVAGALSYGELAGLMPRAGGQYVYLREAFHPLCGFLYGWTLFFVIQTGTIAAVGVAFAKFLGVLWPAVGETNYLVAPLPLAPGYAVSLSTAQLVGVVLIVLLTAGNLFGIDYGKMIQNVFTVSKTGALFGLIVLCLTLGWNATAASRNFGDFWTARPTAPVSDGLPTVWAVTAVGLFAALCVTQTGSLFSSDAWNNIGFAAGEVRDPRRTVAWAMALGTMIVIGLYLLANLGYLATLPLEAIQTAPADRVGTAALEHIFPGGAAVPIMAVAIMISTFGCANGLILAGARAYYAMARDGLFFRAAGRLNRARVPGWALIFQGVWAALLVLPRTVRPDAAAAASTMGALAAPAGPGRLPAAARLEVAPVRPGHLRQPLRQPPRIRHLRGPAVLYPDHRRPVRPAVSPARRAAALPRLRLSGRSGALHPRRRDHPRDAAGVPAGHNGAGLRYRPSRCARILSLAVGAALSPVGPASRAGPVSPAPRAERGLFRRPRELERAYKGGTMTLRRLLLAAGVLAVLASAAWWTKQAGLSTAQAVEEPGSPVGLKMAAAADKYVGMLNDEQKGKGLFAFDDPERTNWHFVPWQKDKKPLRKGLRFDEMTDAEKDAARDLLKTGASDDGYNKAVTIMSLENILRDLEKNGANVRDPQWYFVSIFGKPAKTGKWGWRIEGHHLSLNFTLEDGKVIASTPAFFGANPALVKEGDKKGLRTLPEAEDYAKDLFRLSLDDDQRTGRARRSRSSSRRSRKASRRRTSAIRSACPRRR